MKFAAPIHPIGFIVVSLSAYQLVSLRFTLVNAYLTLLHRVSRVSRQTFAMEKNGVAMLSMAAETVSSRTDDELVSSPVRECRESPSRPPPKLVLPEMTADVRKDLASGRLSSEDLPLSISKRKEWLEYPLKDISQPHPNDVCELCFAFGVSFVSVHAVIFNQPSIHQSSFYPHQYVAEEEAPTTTQATKLSVYLLLKSNCPMLIVQNVKSL